MEINNNKLIQMPFISRQFESYNIPNGNREFTWKLGTKYDKIKYIDNRVKVVSV
uniref:Conserved domain protein n=1 Tax=Heterorhabditis bacteriophora TaxID=37862 RepID=A0A1I7WFD3_HETBA